MAENDLVHLATVTGTDKWGSHFYAQHYEAHFAPFRHRSISLLEIGIGGYDDRLRGGESLRMWKRYFPYASIYGLDLHDKSALEEDRIKTFQGSQIDQDVLQRVVNETGGLDIIIDDGSHMVSHVIQTFAFLFPHLRPGGIYAIEDLQTSYWGSFGGQKDETGTAKTSMNFLKNLADGLNYEEFHSPGYVPSYTDQNITSVHFYHNLCFLYKNPNNEGSNFVANNVLHESLR